MNRTVLITGAAGKFGRVLVQYFLDSGDTVIAVGRTRESLNQLKANCVQDVDSLHLIEVDLMADNAVSFLIENLKSAQLEPDCLVNNARSLAYLALDEEGNASTDNLLNEFKLGVIVPYQLTMALMKESNDSLRSIVNVGSIYGSVAPNLKLYDDALRQSPIQYGVTKAALAHLTKELAVRLADKDIRVNCVAFGGVEGRVDEAFRQRYASLCPAGRMLTEAEIVGPIDMMLSEKASGITGHVLMVDGGWTVW